MDDLIDEGPPDGLDEWPRPRRLAPEEALARAFEAVEEQQYDLNRRAAARAERLAYALDWARTHPNVYVHPGEPEPEATAERCAVMEAGSRLNMSENAVRTLAATAEMAQRSLPHLWSRAREGFAAVAQVDAAASLIAQFGDDADALAAFDRELSDVVLDATPTAFRRRATALARRLAPEPWAARHVRARAERRVIYDPAHDGMMWVHALVTAEDGHASKRMLTSTAKHMQKSERDGRTRDQIRADVFASLIRGERTAAPVKTKVFVTVPLDKLGEKAQATVRRDIAPVTGLDLNSEAQLLGEGPIDQVTAIQSLLDAGAFTRVITDPVTGVVLDMDRRARTVTRAQREWLNLVHGECTRDGCTRLAVEAEVDHWVGFHSTDQGPTNLANLHPLCASDHRLKDRTKVRYRRRPDSTVELEFPTHFKTARRMPHYADPPLGEHPPF